MPSKQAPGRKVTKAEIAEWLMRADTEIRQVRPGTVPLIWEAYHDPFVVRHADKLEAAKGAILAERAQGKGKG